MNTPRQLGDPERAALDAIVEVDINALKRVISQGLQGLDPRETQKNLLLFAIRHSEPQIVSLLIDSGFEVNDYNGAALFEVCENDNLEMAKILISHGADIHIDQDTPIWVASIYGHTDIMRHLFFLDPDEFVKRIPEDDRLSGCPNLVALMNHYNLSQIGDDIPHDGDVVKRSKRFNINVSPHRLKRNLL